MFELSRFRGRRRRLFGPAGFQSVRSRLPEWGISIDSLIVGPDAYVRLYRSDQNPLTAAWLLPGQSVADVIDLHIGDEIDSLQIQNRPPTPGEIGYDNYARTVALLESGGG